MPFKRIIISRTDNLGDVMLTLPVAGVLKKKFPSAEICFIGKLYTQPLINNCQHIDTFIDRDEIVSGLIKLADIQADAIVHVFPDKEIAKAASRAKIGLRIGTSHRFFHWFYCNKLVNLFRKNSDLHESQLNLKLLEPLGIKEDFTLDKIAGFYGFEVNNKYSISEKTQAFLIEEKFNLIIHPKSKGSAREWNLSYYFELIKSLPFKRFHVVVTGTKEEGEKIVNEIPDFFEKTGALDLTGKLNLNELINLIGYSNALIACSTGPLHIAAALDVYAIGIYPPMRPLHPARWAPVGKKTKVFFTDKACNACRNELNCACINAITSHELKEFLLLISAQ